MEIYSCRNQSYSETVPHSETVFRKLDFIFRHYFGEVTFHRIQKLLFVAFRSYLTRVCLGFFKGPSGGCLG